MVNKQDIVNNWFVMYFNSADKMYTEIPFKVYLFTYEIFFHLN